MKGSAVRRCQQMLARIDLPDPSDVEGLCEYVGDRQGRPIKLIGAELPTDRLCGMLVRTDRFDAIFYHRPKDHPRETLTHHQRHVVRHELAHVICGHEAGPVLDEDAAGLLLPHISPQLARRILGRTNYSTKAEREAEIMASLLTAAEPIFGGQRPGVVVRVDNTLAASWIRPA
jgi:hypothetical protein